MAYDLMLLLVKDKQYDDEGYHYHWKMSSIGDCQQVYLRGLEYRDYVIEWLLKLYDYKGIRCCYVCPLCSSLFHKIHDCPIMKKT